MSVRSSHWAKAACSRARLAFGTLVVAYGLLLLPDRDLWFSDRGVITRAAADAYNATQPKVRVKANLLTGNYLEKLQAMVSAGTPPDLQHHNSGQFEALAAKKAFRELEPLLKRDKYRLDDLYPAFQEGVRFTGDCIGSPVDESASNGAAGEQHAIGP